MMRLRVLFYLVACSSLVDAPAKAADTAEDHFERRVRPIFAEKCVQCHGAKKQKAGLRLDSRAALVKGGESGPAVLPGDPKKSLLVRAVRHDGEIKMPPKSRLEPEEIAAIVEWVERGAAWPKDPEGDAKTSATVAVDVLTRGADHWAFRTVADPTPPPVVDAAWPSTPVDRFILAKLEAEGIRPAPPVDKVRLLRRVTFDLTGLPPTPEEIDAFLADESSRAYHDVVERLLASPHYGERWGRHWLDIARFGESAGHDGNNAYLLAWRYRDYVVRSFNSDKPFDRFIVEQLAGDLLPKTGKAAEDFDRVVATGFLQIGPKPVVMRDKRQMLLDIADEQLRHFAEEADEARIRALVSETPGAHREHRDARRHQQAMERHRDEVAAEITRLEGDQDALLDQLQDARR